MKKLTTEEFIRKAKEVQGNRYDYSKVVYKGSKKPVCIICPEHGEFWQIPYSHLIGKKCKRCGGHESSLKQKKELNKIIEEFKNVHGDKYDYSKVEYKNDKTKVCIICPEHGEFWQTPNNHLKGKGCSKCYGNKKLTKEEFIIKAREIHGWKYDYSKVEYKNVDTKVCIICPEHGEFWQTPYKHILRNQGCPICGGKKQLTTEEFIEKAKKVHDNRYDYSKVNYKNNETKVCIICPEHGEFWQAPNKHLRGENCPSCKSSILENKVENILKKECVSYEKEKTFEWLGLQRLDFYLPDYNIAIECQGEQHYRPIDFAGKGEEWAKILFNKNVKNDNKKKCLCEQNGINLFYIKYNENDINKTIKKILKNGN